MNKPMSKTEIAVMTGRTVYQAKVKSAETLGKTEKVLKKSSNGKLGKKISKGSWKGFPIFTLTLEERATCRQTCAHWFDCYGNNMFRATRYQVDASLLPQIWKELQELQKKYPAGFAVRLHVLGDFYSVEYVGFWRMALQTFPALHIWGYTERHDDSVGHAIRLLKHEQGERFRIRFSGVIGIDGALPENFTSMQLAKEKQAFVCPEQTGKTETCSTCGACWQSTKPVVFLTH